MKNNRYAVILAGGRGERFWPLSTGKRPKQLLNLVGEGTLLAQAVTRLDGLIPPERVLVITSADLVAASREAAPMLPAGNVIGEPMGRDTAAAVALAAALVKARDPKAVFAILTADHVISDLPLFQKTLSTGMDLAESGNELVTIGIAPTEPSTAYGYIERAVLKEDREGCRFYRAVRFVEKPDRERATGYLATGNYLWNSGMFIWSVAAIEAALLKHRPALGNLVEAMTEAARTGNLDATLGRIYPTLEKISIDYAVMEKADNILVADGRFAWDDVGSWTALENHFPKDASGNVVVGESAAWQASGNIVVSKDRVTALVGVKDLVVVQTEGVTLVCHRDQAQNIKKLLETIRQTGQHTELL